MSDRRKQPVKSCRFGLLEAFLLFVVFLFLADTALQYAVSASTAKRASREVLRLTAELIEHEVASIRKSTEDSLRDSMHSVARSMFDFSDFRSANAFFMERMETYPHITSINYGDSAGNGYLILLESGRWKNRIKKGGKKGIVTWGFIDNNGKVLSQEQRKDDYDPRVRPWYTDAAGSSGIHWSRPYIFRTTRDIGITASMANDRGTNGSPGVIGADVMLKDLSLFVSGLKSGNADLSINLVSRQGEILASSDVDNFLGILRKGSNELPRISDGGFGDLSAAFHAFEGAGTDFLSFVSSGKSFYAVRRPFSFTREPLYYMVLTVPKQSFLSFFESANTIRVILFLVIIVASGFFFARHYLAPLRKLTSAVQTFGTDAYEPPSLGDRKDEVGVLVSEFCGMADDLTAKQRELSSLINNVPGIVYRGHRDWSISFIGAEVEPTTGHTPEEFTSGTTKWKGIIHPDDLERVKGVFRMATKERLGTLCVEYKILHKDGSIRWLEDRRQLLYNEGGSLSSVDGLLLDVTERKRAEEALRASQKMIEDIINAIPVRVFWKNKNLVYLGCNAIFARDAGFTDPKDVIGKDDYQMGWREQAELYRADDRQVIESGCSKFLIEEPQATPEGNTITLLTSKMPLRNSNGEIGGVLGTYYDITDRKHAEAEKEKLQTQLLQAMKMEAVGRLAGGVAHDFNNLLTVITGYSELLLGKIGKESPMHGEVEEIKRAGERAASLTQQLLAFSRKQIIEPKVVHLDHLVAEMHKMLTRLIGEDIALQATTGKSTGSVKIDPVQFQQILMNLVVNARDAMPDGGKVVVETADADLDEGYCALHPYVKPGRFVMLSVSDTGKGMSEEVKAHIFEPFFTTKERGSGTGLGLATTYGAVHQAGGTIEVYSEVGFGTTFKIYLPQVEEETAKPVNDERPADLPGGTETVLVVEDEDIVRNLCVRILEPFGYRVLQARNGTEAIAEVQGYGDRIDLLLTDVVMPGMNGAELASQLVLRHPEMKVLFTSGYTDDAITRHGILDEGVSFIGKPYTPLGLARKVRGVLDET